MRWRGRRQSSNVEDHRSDSGGGSGGFGRGGRGGGFKLPGGLGGLGGARRASGGGVKGIIILAVIYFAAKFIFGIDLMQLMSGGGQGVQNTRVEQSQKAPRTTKRSGKQDELGQFAGVIPG